MRSITLPGQFVSITGGVCYNQAPTYDYGQQQRLYAECATTALTSTAREGACASLRPPASAFRGWASSASGRSWSGLLRGSPGPRFEHSFLRSTTGGVRVLTAATRPPLPPAASLCQNTSVFRIKPPEAGLCASCQHARQLSTQRGSTFWLCERGASDPAYPRYPPLPVRECAGWDSDETQEV